MQRFVFSFGKFHSSLLFMPNNPVEPRPASGVGLVLVNRGPAHRKRSASLFADLGAAKYPLHVSHCGLRLLLAGQSRHRQCNTIAAVIKVQLPH